MHKILIFLFMAFTLITCKSQPKTAESFGVIEPEFNVISIYIIQADIVVTEFEAVIRINNPNDFPVELSSITYELYGNEAFWTGGNVNNVFQIPAFSSGENRFTFSMNFINMSRRLLDDVIAMRQVNYRFKGQAQVRPMVNGISVFNVYFNCYGLSEVKRKSN
jgi:LEA14-like dessication related protein